MIYFIVYLLGLFYFLYSVGKYNKEKHNGDLENSVITGLFCACLLWPVSIPSLGAVYLLILAYEWGLK